MKQFLNQIMSYPTLVPLLVGVCDECKIHVYVFNHTDIHRMNTSCWQMSLHSQGLKKHTNGAQTHTLYKGSLEFGAQMLLCFYLSQPITFESFFSSTCS